MATVSIVWIVFAVFFASTGAYNIDELVYLAMFAELTDNGRFTIQNGYELFQAPELLLQILRPEPDGVVAQYPHGFVIFSAPFWALAEERGVIVLNTLSTIAVMVLTWLTAHRLFLDRAVAGFSALTFALATFAVDYAFAIWPHAFSNAIVWFAIFCAASAWRESCGSDIDEITGATMSTKPSVRTGSNWKNKAASWTLVAGVAVGFGTSVRVDAIIAAPILLIWVTVFWRKPFSSIAIFLIGLVPGLLFCSILNEIKFGQFFPISYGSHVGGGTNLAGYAKLLPLAAVGSLAALAVGFQSVRSVLRGKRWILAAACLVIGLSIVPTTRDLILQLAEGGYVLGIDMQSLDLTKHGRGAMITPDGTMLMFGIPKKALLQSMPFMLLGIILLPRLFSGQQSAQLALLLLLVFMWLTPFAFKSWHGGMSNNMRYLSPAIPAISILTGLVFSELRSLMGPDNRFATLCRSAIYIGAVTTVALSQSPTLFFQTKFAVFFGATSAIFALVYLCVSRVRKVIAPVLMSLLYTGLIFGFLVGTIWDTGTSQKARRSNAALERMYAQIPSRSFVYAVTSDGMSFQMKRPQAFLAIQQLPKAMDVTLVDKALANGWQVYVQMEHRARSVIAARPYLKIGTVVAGNLESALYEIKRTGQ